jgi:hypothetical protein
MINLNHVISLRRDDEKNATEVVWVVEEDDLMVRELPNDILKNARSLA